MLSRSTRLLPVALACLVSGVAHAQDSEEEEEDAIYEVVVEATHAEDEDTHARTTLSEEELAKSQGQDLAHAVEQVSGVTAARGTANASKPIIRGQTERRLLLLFDGVRHESQKWGADHATEIDPLSAGEVSVIKGAAGVQYGPDAIGGVILVSPPTLREEPGVDGHALLVGDSNGRRGVAGLRLDVAPAKVPGLVVRAQADASRGAALSTPTYVLGNTGSAQWSGGLRAKYRHELATVTLAYQHYDLKAGVCFCVRQGTSADFLSQLEADAPVGASAWTTSYAIDRPYQAVTHDLALARVAVPLGVGALNLTYAFQLNHRQELAQVRSAVTGPQYDFTLRTHTFDLRWTHGSVDLGTLGIMDGGAGGSGAFQENVYSGLPLIPNHRSFTGGAFLFERTKGRRVDLELGARYDHQSRASFLTDSAFQRHLARDTLRPRDCVVVDGVSRCDRTFDTGSVSTGALWHVTPERLDLKLDLSSASRFPNSDELYMNGTAPTSPVYALGDPSLGVETTWGGSQTLGLRLPALEGELSTYASLIHNYIYFAPELGPDGAPAFDVTAQGANPRFGFQAVNALFYGVDGALSVGLTGPVGLKAQGSVVRGQDQATSEGLLFIPPPRVRVEGLLRRAGRPKSSLGLSALYVAQQTHVLKRADLAPPPGAYLLVGASAAMTLPMPWGEALTLGVEGQNLLNTRYRDYTSLLRYFSDEPGRSVRVRAGVDF